MHPHSHSQDPPSIATGAVLGSYSSMQHIYSLILSPVAPNDIAAVSASSVHVIFAELILRVPSVLHHDCVAITPLGCDKFSLKPRLNSAHS